MRIGICTTDFKTHMPAMDLFRKMADMGYETTQLAFSSVTECGFAADTRIEIPGSVSLEAIAAIRAAAEATGITVCAVNGTWNMAHPDREVREEGIRRFDGFLAAVAALGCPIASLCSGSRNAGHLWRPHPDNSAPEAWADMLDSMRRCARLAEKHGIVLAIETEASNVIDTPEKARIIMDEVGSPNLKMILDCANLFHAGDAKPENVRPAIDRAFACYGRDIVLAHGKDIRAGEGIDFCGTGFGIVDFPYTLDCLKDAGYTGEMVLHGIYRDEDMHGCLAFMKKCMNR